MNQGTSAARFNPSAKDQSECGKWVFAGLALLAVMLLSGCADIARDIDRSLLHSIRMAEVGRTTDQDALARTAVNSKDWEVRSNAVSKLSDQALINGIVTNYGVQTAIRLLAVEGLTNQLFLAGAATSVAAGAEHSKHPASFDREMSVLLAVSLKVTSQQAMMAELAQTA